MKLKIYNVSVSRPYLEFNETWIYKYLVDKTNSHFIPAYQNKLYVIRR